MTKKLNRILVLASTYPRWRNDTIPKFVEDYCIAISRNFNRVDVLVPHFKGALIREYINNNIYINRFRYFWPASQEDVVYVGHAAKKVNSNLYYLFKLSLFLIFQFLNTFFRAIPAEILNAHWIVPQGFIAVCVGKLLSKKVVITVHGGDVFTLNGKIMRHIKRFVLKHADVVVCNSSATVYACKQLYPDRLYKVIPMGINTALFKPPPTKTKKKKFIVVFSGRLSKEKGVEYLLKAAKQVEKIIPLQLIIVGEGPERNKLEQYAQKMKIDPIISFTGWKTHRELISIYQSGDVFVGPSIEDQSGWKEALGLVFAEASACGLPVIATKTGGIKDVVAEGETGYMVGQKNSRAIADKLIYLYQNKSLATCMGNKGARLVRDKFSWEKVSDQYVVVFNKLNKTDHENRI